MSHDSDTAGGTSPATSSTEEQQRAEYWSANLRIIGILLAIWAFVSLGLGILFRPMLQGIMVGGVDLGFWFAQQGAIYTFLVLIFYYAYHMNALDRKYGVEE